MKKIMVAVCLFIWFVLSIGITRLSWSLLLLFNTVVVPASAIIS